MWTVKVLKGQISHFAKGQAYRNVEKMPIKHLCSLSETEHIIRLKIELKTYKME